MRVRRWGIASLVVGASVLALCRVGGSRPEKKLAAHVDELTQIMKRNLATPEAGVTELFDHNREHVSAMLALWGEIIAALDRIEDDRARERRGRQIVAGLRPALDRFGQAAERFFDRVDRDPRARAALEKRLARLKPLEDLFQSLSAALRRLGRP